MQKASFRKKERLKSRKAIARLFAEGRSLSEAPLKMVWLWSNKKADGSVKMTVTVPKRIFGRAVDRNLLKRRIREAYRQHKSDLLTAVEGTDRSLELVLIYTGREILDYNNIEEKIIHILKRFIAKQLLST